jgi:hypothetical protein
MAELSEVFVPSKVPLAPDDWDDAPVPKPRPWHKLKTNGHAEPAPATPSALDAFDPACDAPPPDLIDREHVREFVSELFAGAERVVAAVEPRPDRPGVLQVFRIHPTSDDVAIVGRYRLGDAKEVKRMADDVIAAAEAGHNVYVEARLVGDHVRGTARGELGDTTAVFALVIDRDGYSGKAGTDFAEPTMRVETSENGAHDWFFLSEPITGREGQALGEALRLRLGADSATFKPTQPYRVAGTPNFPNLKKTANGRAPCRTQFINGGPLYTDEQLEKLIGFVEPVSTSTPKGPSPFEEVATGAISERAERLLSAPVTAKMDRSVQIFAATCAAIEDGLAAIEFEDLCRKHHDGCAGKFLKPKDRLRKEIERIWRKKAPEIEAREAQETEQQKPHQNKLLLWYGEVPADPPPYLIQDTLPQTGIAFLAGQYGLGKTFGGIDVTAAVLTGKKFAGQQVNRRGGVLWLAAEGENEVDSRLKAALEASGNPPDAKYPFARQCHSVPLLTDGDAATKLQALADEAAKTMRADFGNELVLIVIDTLGAAAGFDDENSASETQRVVNLLKKLSRHTGALVLVIDHHGKVAETGIRGSSAKAAAADAILAFLGDRDITGKVANRRMAIAKLRSGSSGRVIPFYLQPFDNTCVIEWRLDAQPEKKADSSEKLPKGLIIFSRAIDAALKDFGGTRPDGGDGSAVDREKVRDEFLRLYPADDVQSKGKAFRRLEQEAVARGMIVAHDEGGITLFWRAHPKTDMSAIDGHKGYK